MILADFHIHSTFSDGKLTIPQIVDFYGSRGFGAIAITDHICEEQTLLGKIGEALGHSVTPKKFIQYREILKVESERAWEEYRMLVIPGVELSQNTVSNKRSAHVLALGVDSWISADGTIQDLLKNIHAQGAIAVAAHPVSTRKFEKQTYFLWDQREELSAHFDAWEVASGPYIFDEVMATSLRKIANSDLHKPQQMTSWKTVFECERSQDAIFDAIRKQDLHFKFYEETCHSQIHHPSYNAKRKTRFWANPFGTWAGA